MSLYWVIDYHVTLSEGHMILTLIYMSQIYSYYISGDMSTLKTLGTTIIVFSPFF